MYCNACGTQVREGARFCSSCGAPLNDAGRRAAARPKRGRKRWLLLLGAVVAIAALIAVIASQPQTINLEEYVKVDFVGENTEGRAYPNLEIFAFEEVFAEAFGKDHISQVEEADFLACTDGINLTVEPMWNLSNGDVVTVYIEYDNSALRDYPIRYSGTSVSFVVEGLRS